MPCWIPGFAMPEIAAARAAILRRPARLVGAALLTFLVLAAVVGPGLVYLWNGSDYRSQDLVNTMANPSSLHPLGTDALGRDALARLLYGCRISLLVGTVSTAVSLLIGVAYGGLAGYAGGQIDGVMMRLLDGFFSIPLVILVAVLFAL